jgi:hypothetical protein
MIRLKRPAITKPLDQMLKSRAAEAAKFYGRSKELRKQARFDFSLGIDCPEMRFSKCAYCELKLTAKDIYTCRYRPEAAAREWPEGKE